MKPGDLVRIKFPERYEFEPYADWNGCHALVVSKSSDFRSSRAWLVLIDGEAREVNGRYLRRIDAAR